MFCVLSYNLFWRIVFFAWEDCISCCYWMGVWYTFVKSIWSKVWSNFHVPSLIFCVDNLLIANSGSLKCPTTVDYFSFQIISFVLPVYLGALMLGTYVCTNVVSSWFIKLFITYSNDLFVCYCCWLDVYFVWYKNDFPYYLLISLAVNIFFHPFTLSMHAFSNEMSLL